MISIAGFLGIMAKTLATTIGLPMTTGTARIATRMTSLLGRDPALTMLTF
jgi:hypothetical protein